MALTISAQDFSKAELQSWHQCWPVSSTSQLHLSNFRYHGNVPRSWPSLNLAKKPTLATTVLFLFCLQLVRYLSVLLCSSNYTHISLLIICFPRINLDFEQGFPQPLLYLTSAKTFFPAWKKEKLLVQHSWISPRPSTPMYSTYEVTIPFSFANCHLMVYILPYTEISGHQSGYCCVWVTSCYRRSSAGVHPRPAFVYHIYKRFASVSEAL